MNVELVIPVEDVPVAQWTAKSSLLGLPPISGFGTVAVLKPYTNTISGLYDPMLVYGPSRWIHLSTALWPVGGGSMRLVLRDADTGELVEQDTLAAIKAAHQARIDAHPPITVR